GVRQTPPPCLQPRGLQDPQAILGRAHALLDRARRLPSARVVRDTTFNLRSYSGASPHECQQKDEPASLHRAFPSAIAAPGPEARHLRLQEGYLRGPGTTQRKNLRAQSAGVARVTQRPASQTGATFCSGGRQSGCGQEPALPEQVGIRASSSSARFRVTARGVQSIGQHAPGATLVNPQSASFWQGVSSAAPASPVGATTLGDSSRAPPSRGDTQASTTSARTARAFIGTA